MLVLWFCLLVFVFWLIFSFLSFDLDFDILEDLTAFWNDVGSMGQKMLDSVKEGVVENFESAKESVLDFFGMGDDDSENKNLTGAEDTVATSTINNLTEAQPNKSESHNNNNNTIVAPTTINQDNSRTTISRNGRRNSRNNDSTFERASYASLQGAFSF